MKYILIILMIAVVLVLFALSPVFNITTIKVTGNDHYSREEIINASGVVPGGNGFKTIGINLSSILKLRYSKAENNIIQKCPYVGSAIVRYILPDKINIGITERKPFYLMRYLGTYLLIDRDGYVVDTVESIEKYELPVIQGLKFENYETGHVLKLDNPQKFDKAVEIIDTIIYLDNGDKFKISGMIKSIDVNDLNKICLSVDWRITVNLGDLQDLSYRIDYLRQILLNSIKKDDKGLIDFTAGQNPVFINEK